MHVVVFSIELDLRRKRQRDRSKRRGVAAQVIRDSSSSEKALSVGTRHITLNYCTAVSDAACKRRLLMDLTCRKRCDLPSPGRFVGCCALGSDFLAVGMKSSLGSPVRRSSERCPREIEYRAAGNCQKMRESQRWSLPEKHHSQPASHREQRAAISGKVFAQSNRPSVRGSLPELPPYAKAEIVCFVSVSGPDSAASR